MTTVMSTIPDAIRQLDQPCWTITHLDGQIGWLDSEPCHRTEVEAEEVAARLDVPAAPRLRNERCWVARAACCGSLYESGEPRHAATADELWADIAESDWTVDGDKLFCDLRGRCAP